MNETPKEMERIRAKIWDTLKTKYVTDFPEIGNAIGLDPDELMFLATAKVEYQYYAPLVGIADCTK
jgi:hypothetical protein